LYARKKGKNPDRAWLERVPLKAKTLESQLYKNAASLEAYLNRSTLKVRLGKLASAITSHYKQAIQSRRTSTRSSSSSIASLENAFADAKLRRQSSSSIQSLPSSLNNRSNKNINNINMGKSDNSNNNNSNLVGALPFASHVRSQSDSHLPSSRSNKTTSSVPSISTGSANDNFSSNQNRIMPKGNNPNFAGGSGGAGMSGGNGVDFEQQQQQQLLACIRQQQQQQNFAGRMSVEGSNSTVVNASPATPSSNLSMMGVGRNFSMLNHQAMMQQHNAMNVNLLQQQQQQNMLFQQQQQQQQQQQHQPMSQTGLSLHNISIMQQQQQRQLQLHQNPMMSLAGGQINNNAMGMNMINSNLSAMIPALNVNQNPQMQAMMNNPMALVGNNNGMSNMMDMMNMSSPGMVGAAAISAQQRSSSVGNIPSNSDDPNSPLSPRSFDW
jgi:hypothetical protein